MSMQAHLAELEKRHRALEVELAEALAHPSTDDLKIAELKRRKLLVKDQIARLRTRPSPVSIDSSIRGRIDPRFAERRGELHSRGSRAALGALRRFLPFRAA